MAWITKRQGARGAAYRVSWREPEGRVRSRTFTRRRDADAYATEVEHSKNDGSYRDPKAGREVLGSYWIRWFAVAGSRLKPSTLARYEALWRLYLNPVLGAYRLASLKRGDVERLRDGMMASGCGAPTVAQALRLAHALMASAVSDELIARNPAAGVKPPALSSTEQRFLTPQEVARLVDEFSERWQAFVLTAAWGGLRFGELAALRVERIDFLRRVVRVEEAFSEVSGRQVLGSTKTGSRRSVALPRTAVDALGAHLAAYPPGSDGLVFTNAHGGPVWRHGFTRRVWNPAVTRADLGPLRFHDLRHTSVALAIAAGGHAKAIQARAGHSTIRTTLDRYGHLLEGLDTELAERLETLAATGPTAPRKDARGD